MSGLDGINSLQKLVGALQANDTSNVGGPGVVSSSAQAKTSGTAVAAGGNTDSASLSAAGGLAAQATDTSDVRLTKVAELRQAISSGSYNVPASSVSDKMVEGLLK